MSKTIKVGSIADLKKYYKVHAEKQGFGDRNQQITYHAELCLHCGVEFRIYHYSDMRWTAVKYCGLDCLYMNRYGRPYNRDMTTCSNCGKENLSEYKTCDKCREAVRQWKLNTKDPRRKQEGFCSTCGGANPSTYKTCDRCRTFGREWNAAHREQRNEASKICNAKRRAARREELKNIYNKDNRVSLWLDILAEKQKECVK